MCQSAPIASLASIPLTSYLAQLNSTSTSLDIHPSRAPPDALDVSAYPQQASLALALDSVVGEVIWLGVPGPS